MPPPNPNCNQDWLRDNWGTGRDVDITSVIEISDIEIEIIFETAWTPPIQAIDALASQNPHLNVELSFQEPDCEFGGDYSWENSISVKKDDYTFTERAKANLTALVLNNGGYGVIAGGYLINLAKVWLDEVGIPYVVDEEFSLEAIILENTEDLTVLSLKFSVELSDPDVTVISAI